MSVRGGPWYCRRHYDLEMGQGQDLVGKSDNKPHMDMIRNLIRAKTSLPERQPGQDETEAT